MSLIIQTKYHTKSQLSTTVGVQLLLYTGLQVAVNQKSVSNNKGKAVLVLCLILAHSK